MSDYYSQNDRRGRTTPDYYDNVGNGGMGWLWAGSALCAGAALIAAIFSGGGGDPAAPATGDAAAPAGTEQLITPAPADATPTVTE